MMFSSKEMLTAKIEGRATERGNRRILRMGADGEQVIEVPAYALRMGKGDFMPGRDVWGVQEQCRTGLRMQGLSG